jgi:hypothetical protein
MFEMLRVYVYSVSKHVDCELFIYQDGLSPRQITELSKITDKVRIVSFDTTDIKGAEKPAQKVRIWSEIAHDPAHESQPLILSDFDMLFMNDPSFIFEDMCDGDVDLCYTMKDNQYAKYRLNTGILFLRTPKNCRQLMRAWSSDVTRSLGNDLVAKSMANTHGSVDQCVLMSWLESSNSMCRSRPVACSVFNLHKGWDNIPDKCCVIHYKSTWDKVLTCGDVFHHCLKRSGWWTRDEAYTWEPAFDMWKRYQKMLEDYLRAM